jgi:signal transduction histidine kinase
LFRGAVGNLVSNAIAYTPKGGFVTLSAERRNDEFKITVADTGTGIPTEAIPKIFDRFYRVDPARAKTLGGTGLGLAIVKSIVQLHRGRIDVQSTLGRGTRIALIFPAGGTASASTLAPAKVSA